MTKLSVIYYSSTGTVDAMARRCAEAAEKQGAEVRLRRVAELAPESAIAANDAWQQHHEAVKDEPVATADDVTWADAVLFGSPTRYGNIASQLKQFLDTLGGQWSRGELADKAYSGFTSSSTAHGGQETTLLALYNSIYHFGGIIVPPGYTDQLKFNDGNPYGVSQVSGASGPGNVGDAELAALDHLVSRVLTVGELLAGSTGGQEAVEDQRANAAGNNQAA
jgi:NAD(P)H dehydrogenase (quinone)